MDLFDEFKFGGGSYVWDARKRWEGVLGLDAAEIEHFNAKSGVETLQDAEKLIRSWRYMSRPLFYPILVKWHHEST